MWSVACLLVYNSLLNTQSILVQQKSPKVHWRQCKDSPSQAGRKISASFGSTKGTSTEPHLSIRINQKPSELDNLSIPLNKISNSSTEIQSVPEDHLHLHLKEKQPLEFHQLDHFSLLEFGCRRSRRWVTRLCISNFKCI